MRHIVILGAALVCFPFVGSCADDGADGATASSARAVSSGRPAFPNAIRYRVTGSQAATGREGSATLTARALLGQDGRTDLELTTGALDSEEIPPGNIAGTQLKVITDHGRVAYNEEHAGLTGGGYVRSTYDHFVRGQPLEVTARIAEIDPRVDVVTVVEPVKLRPDLAVTSLDGPSEVPSHTPVWFQAVVQELNFDVGATADCVLQVDGTPVDRAARIWVDAGGVVSCAFAYEFEHTGTYDVAASIEGVTPGDFDAANDTAHRSITVIDASRVFTYGGYIQSMDAYTADYVGDAWYTDPGTSGRAPDGHWTMSQRGWFQSSYFYGEIGRAVLFPVTITFADSSDGVAIDSDTYAFDVADHWWSETDDGSGEVRKCATVGRYNSASYGAVRLYSCRAVDSSGAFLRGWSTVSRTWETGDVVYYAEGSGVSFNPLGGAGGTWVWSFSTIRGTHAALGSSYSAALSVDDGLRHDASISTMLTPFASDETYGTCSSGWVWWFGDTGRYCESVHATFAGVTGGWYGSAVSDDECVAGVPCSTGNACEVGTTACPDGVPTCVSAGPQAAGTVCRESAGACDATEVCDGVSMDCPSDRLVAAGTTCRASVGGCDLAETCTGVSATCPSDGVAARGTVCRAAASVCDAVETCDGVATACPADRFAPAGTICRVMAGPCDVAEVCTGASGACPTDAFTTGTPCRATAGPCDVAEYCNGTGARCPADGFVAAGTICRAMAGTCDVVEVCTGSAPTCPANAFVAVGTICRAAAGPCDAVEVCQGTAACPADGFAAIGTICRVAAGPCDVVETCTGTALCPADGFRPAGTVCRAMAGTCDVIEVCQGSGARCPADGFVAAGTTCRAAAAPCDVAEVCSGTAACPVDGFVAAGTTCRAAAGPCDVRETCTGTAASCPANGFAAAGSICRPAAGPCDAVEACTGASATCPADGFAAAGTTCRASIGGCDIAEACTGAAAACPLDRVSPAGTVCRAAESECRPGASCDGGAPWCPPELSTDGQYCTEGCAPDSGGYCSAFTCLCT